jgi:hypothetical protein
VNILTQKLVIDEVLGNLHSIVFKMVDVKSGAFTKLSQVVRRIEMIASLFVMVFLLV